VLARRLRGGLARTREVLNTPVGDLLRGRPTLDESALETLEEALLSADLGPHTAQELIDQLRSHSAEVAAGGPAAMRRMLCEQVRDALEQPGAEPQFVTRPWVTFVVGVNGVGKTTTIGKLARSWIGEGRSVMLVAADTFRAAAAEQLEVWAQRAGAGFHRGPEGSDPAAVLTDGLRSARARGCDAVLVDTAGRLHTRGNLMAELAKMSRVAGREVAGAPHETWLVLDATVGSNGLNQAREFARSGGVTGLVLTKLDGTARGGVALAVVRELKVPIRFVGVGEDVEDLVPFDPAEFAEGLFGE